MKNAALTDGKRRPAFIPPFKKQECSSKAQEQDLHRQPFVASSKSNTYVPPIKKSQSSKDAVCNESKVDIQTAACEAEDSVSKGQGAATFFS